MYTGSGAQVPAATSAAGKKGKKGPDGHVSFGKTSDTEENEVRYVNIQKSKTKFSFCNVV